MKKLISTSYSIVCYLLGFASLLYWIASTGNLLPFASIDGTPTASVGAALFKNVLLILLFGIQHTVMARKSFKRWITRFIPAHLERSTYVLATAIVLTILVSQWEPLGGVIWAFETNSIWYYLLYAGFFAGWFILFLSTFLINHFDLFGLRQAYLNLKDQPYEEVDFKIVSLYKIVRHPLYFGALIGIWCTPTMTITHLVYSTLLTLYILVGVYYEEKDLVQAFGERYKAYKSKTPGLLPIKFRR